MGITLQKRKFGHGHKESTGPVTYCITQKLPAWEWTLSKTYLVDDTLWGWAVILQDVYTPKSITIWCCVLSGLKISDCSYQYSQWPLWGFGLLLSIPLGSEGKGVTILAWIVDPGHQEEVWLVLHQRAEKTTFSLQVTDKCLLVFLHLVLMANGQQQQWSEESLVISVSVPQDWGSGSSWQAPAKDALNLEWVEDNNCQL